jgi:hypothetical protein
MRFFSKSLLLKAGMIVIAACLGATAMYAWQAQANKGEHKSAAAMGSMSTIILELHKRPHTDKLPAEVIEGYN